MNYCHPNDYYGNRKPKPPDPNRRIIIITRQLIVSHNRLAKNLNTFGRAIVKTLHPYQIGRRQGY